MSEIERYLETLRSALEVDAKRADEIIAEVRSHLEARAAELEAGGLSHDEAAAEAVRSFGEPEQIARELLERNARHRRPQVLRAVRAVVISLGAGLALGGLYSAPGSANSPSVRLAGALTGLREYDAGWLLMFIALTPAALLAGMTGGRRFWWLACAPAVLYICWLWTSELLSGGVPGLPASGGLRDTAVHALAVPGAAGVLLAGIGWLGARLARARPKVRPPIRALGLLCAAYVLWLAATSLWSALSGIGALGIIPAIAQPALLVLLAAARRDGWLRRGAFLRASIAVCGLGLVYTAFWVIAFVAAGAGSLSAADPNGWFVFSACESVIGLAVMAAYRARGRRRPATPVEGAV